MLRAGVWRIGGECVFYWADEDVCSEKLLYGGKECQPQVCKGNDERQLGKMMVWALCGVVKAKQAAWARRVTGPTCPMSNRESTPCSRNLDFAILDRTLMCESLSV